ncbi:hypothetical protein Ciccas_008635 [Cichlidogyrus casuarinus]|uniref:Uncharacterized protein n=1 Tax=Cichlidogyrus casuarinus TaxID=1844966 RepID=A0ABD2Q092_9PLAT
MQATILSLLFSASVVYGSDQFSSCAVLRENGCYCEDARGNVLWNLMSTDIAFSSRAFYMAAPENLEEVIAYKPCVSLKCGNETNSAICSIKNQNEYRMLVSQTNIVSTITPDGSASLTYEHNLKVNLICHPKENFLKIITANKSFDVPFTSGLLVTVTTEKFERVELYSPGACPVWKSTKNGLNIEIIVGISVIGCIILVLIAFIGRYAYKAKSRNPTHTGNLDLNW